MRRSESLDRRSSLSDPTAPSRTATSAMTSPTAPGTRRSSLRWEVSRMARGDPPMALEQLLPYFRGARFALVAVKMRHPDDMGLGADVDNYVGMLQRFEA